MLERTPAECLAMASAAGSRPEHRPDQGICVAARGLTLDIQGARLLDGIDLSLRASSLSAIMGPNGAGKSLLLRLLHGLIQPTHGELFWFGSPLDTAMRKRQAMVFQRPVLLRRSVAANIDFVLGLRGSVDVTRRDALLDRVGLLARARQPARLLSGGEQQRLALARALALSPEVLFLDEPTASLDPASAAVIERIVLDARGQGMTILLVTHDAAQARRLADDVVFIDRGRVLEHAPAGQFFSAPSSPQARAYLEGRLWAWPSTSPRTDKAP